MVKVFNEAILFDASQLIIFEHPSMPRNAKPAIIEFSLVVVNPCVAFAIHRSKILP